MRPGPALAAIAAVTAAAAAALSPAAGAEARSCGSGSHGAPGYAYAGHQATATAHGVRATITALARPIVSAGHVAGWIGVGGPGQGTGGQTVWLQAGIASLPGTAPMLYAEITRAGKAPQFVPLQQDVAVGESHTVAVLEMSGRPGWWRVYVDGRPSIGPVHLASSTARWRPIATAESWNGGTSSCNGFAFRFDGVGVAGASGGSWRPFVPGYRFQDRGFAVKRLSVAGGGTRTLSTGGVEPYAFEASSV